MRLIFLIAALLAVTPVLAQQWGSYANARFGYTIEVPPGFAGEAEADNGDGRVFVSADGTARLTVYGSTIPEGGFENAMAAALAAARAEGWAVNDERVTPSWATFSGTRNGMMLSARAIALCGGVQLARVSLTYPERAVGEMEAVVERLASSFRPGEGASC